MSKKVSHYLERVEQLRDVREAKSPQSIRMDAETYLLEVLDLIWQGMNEEEKEEVSAHRPDWPKKE